MGGRGQLPGIVCSIIGGWCGVRGQVPGVVCFIIGGSCGGQRTASRSSFSPFLGGFGRLNAGCQACTVALLTIQPSQQPQKKY